MQSSSTDAGVKDQSSSEQRVLKWEPDLGIGLTRIAAPFGGVWPEAAALLYPRVRPWCRPGSPTLENVFLWSPSGPILAGQVLGAAGQIAHVKLRLIQAAAPDAFSGVRDSVKFPKSCQGAANLRSRLAGDSTTRLTWQLSGMSRIRWNER